MPKVINLLGYHIAEDIEKYIYQNNLLPGDKIPSERELAKHYNVTRVTLRNGLQRLIDDGVIYNIPNSGYFVSQHKILRDAENYFFPQNDYFLNDYLYTQESIDCVDVTTRLLGINLLDSDYHNLKINGSIEKVNDIPISLTYTIQNQESYEKYPHLFSQEKPKHLLQKQRVRVYHANNYEMEMLNITTNDSLFLINQFISDDSGLIAVCESICVGTRCEVQFNINT